MTIFGAKSIKNNCHQSKQCIKEPYQKDSQTKACTNDTRVMDTILNIIVVYRLKFVQYLKIMLKE